MFEQIQHPNTGEWVNISGVVGRRVLKKYIQCGGASPERPTLVYPPDDIWQAQDPNYWFNSYPQTGKARPVAPLTAAAAWISNQRHKEGDTDMDFGYYKPERHRSPELEKVWKAAKCAAKGSHCVKAWTAKIANASAKKVGMPPQEWARIATDVDMTVAQLAQHQKEQQQHINRLEKEAR